MVLVDYPDSASDPEDQESLSRKSTDDEHASCQTITNDKPRSLARKRKADDNGTQSSTNITPSTARSDRAAQRPTRPPPLPSSLRSLYATNTRTSTSDDPSLHGGRKRQIAHVEGNWPSHIYLEWVPTPSQITFLDDIISRTQTIVNNCDFDSTPDQNPSRFKLNTFLQTDLQVPLPLHISLSAPIVLRTATKDNFHLSLAEAIARSRIGVLNVHVANLDLVPNLEGSRWFVVLRVKVVGEEGGSVGRLARLLDVCNAVCRGFGLVTLYERGSGIGVGRADTGRGSSQTLGRHEDGKDQDGRDRRANPFHVSIAWMLGEVEGGKKNNSDKTVMATARDAVRNINLNGITAEEIRFSQVKVKIGNTIDGLPL